MNPCFIWVLLFVMEGVQLHSLDAAINRQPKFAKWYRTTRMKYKMLASKRRRARKDNAA